MNDKYSFLRKPVTAIALSILIGFIVGAAVLAMAGYNPLTCYTVLFKGVFGSPKYVAQTIISATPVIITGLSVVFAFKTGLFNIGAEGQFMMGAIAACFFGYNLQLPPVLHAAVVIIGAMAVAGVYGGIVGFLKAQYGIHEVLSSIMLNWIALYVNNYYVTLYKKPNTEAVYEIHETAFIKVLHVFKTSPDGIDSLSKNPFLREVLLKTDLNYGIFLAIFAAVAVWLILERTTLGYSLKAVGLNKYAAELAGIDVKNNIFVSMFISGAIAGLGGAVYVTGVMPHRISTLAMHENFGFNGLSVALMGNVNPFGCIFSGFLFGGLKYGGGFLQSELGAPSEIINIMIGVIVFFIGMKNAFTMLADYMKKGAK